MKVPFEATLFAFALVLGCSQQSDSSAASGKSDAKGDAVETPKSEPAVEPEPEPEPAPPPAFMSEPERLGPKGELLADHERRSVEIAGLKPRGPANAPVVIVACVDLADLFCKRGQATVAEVQAALPEQVALYLRPYWNLLESYEQAVARGDKDAKARAELTRRLAAALVAADRQGKLWELHDQLLTAERDQLEGEGLDALASAAGLDLETWKSQLGDEQTLAAVEAHKRACQQLGVDRGVPAYFINGRMMLGARKPDELRYVVEVELHGGFEKLPKAAAEAP